MEVSQKLKKLLEEEINDFFEKEFDKNNIETFKNVKNVKHIEELLNNLYNKKYLETLSKKSGELFGNVDIFKNFIEEYNKQKNKLQDKELFYDIYSAAFDLIYLSTLIDSRISQDSTNEHKVETSMFYKEIIDNLNNKYVNNFKKAFKKEDFFTIEGLLIYKFEKYSLVYRQTLFDDEILGFFVEREDYKILIIFGEEYGNEGKRFSVFLFKNQECYKMTLYFNFNFEDRRQDNLEDLGFAFEDLSVGNLSGVNFSSYSDFYYFNREIEDNGKYKIDVFNDSDKLVQKIFKRTFRDQEDLTLSFILFNEEENYIEKHYAKYLECKTTSRKNCYLQEYFEKTFNIISDFRGHIVVKDFEQAQNLLELYDLGFSS